MAPIFTSLLFFKLNLKPRSKTLRPPLLVLLGTNDSDPPTEQDISRIRDGIARVESKLKKEGLHGLWIIYQISQSKAAEASK